MQGARFKPCDLSTSRFRSTILFGALFEDCTAQGTNFENATFSNSVGGSSRLSNTDVTLHKSNFDYADFQGLSFEGCKITDCSLRESQLRGCDFKNTDMTGTNISGAETDKANFEGTDLRAANVGGLQLSTLSNFRAMKISSDQQQVLLAGLNIQVFP